MRVTRNIRILIYDPTSKQSGKKERRSPPAVSSPSPIYHSSFTVLPPLAAPPMRAALSASAATAGHRGVGKASLVLVNLKPKAQQPASASRPKRRQLYTSAVCRDSAAPEPEAMVPNPADPNDKTKGFMRYKRVDAPYRDATERAKDWHEISVRAAKNPAARCVLGAGATRSAEKRLWSGRTRRRRCTCRPKPPGAWTAALRSAKARRAARSGTSSRSSTT